MHKKSYFVTCKGHISEDTAQELRDGILLPGEEEKPKTAPAVMPSFKISGNRLNTAKHMGKKLNLVRFSCSQLALFSPQNVKILEHTKERGELVSKVLITIREGRNRQIRRMFYGVRITQALLDK